MESGLVFAYLYLWGACPGGCRLRLCVLGTLLWGSSFLPSAVCGPWISLYLRSRFGRASVGWPRFPGWGGRWFLSGGWFALGLTGFLVSVVGSLGLLEGSLFYNSRLGSGSLRIHFGPPGYCCL